MTNSKPTKSKQSNSNLDISTDTKANCPNCQSDNDTVASTINNTCPLCGRTLNKNLRGIDEATKQVSNTRQTCINETRSTDKKANNPEDLWDWCCTEVYRLDNGEDVWKQINKVHQLALKEQREEILNILKKNSASLPISIEMSGIYAQGMHAGLDLAIDEIVKLQLLKEKNDQSK